MRKTLAVFVATASLAIPATAQAYVPNRHEALHSATNLLHDNQVMNNVLGHDANGNALASDGIGLYWRSLTPKIRRVHGGWNTCAIVIRGHNANGELLTRVGFVKIRGFKHGYSTTLKLVK